MTAYEKKGELIRAPIRTKLGNVVMRWIKPDNPNIVVEKAAPAAVAKAIEVEVVPVEVDEVFPKAYEHYTNSVCQCCGATYFRALADDAKREWTPEKIKASWEAAWGRTYRNYEERLQRSTAERDIVYQKQMMEYYSLERYTDSKGYLRSTYTRIDDKPGTGAGVTISPDPFEGYEVKTPAGWYLRCDRPKVSKAEDDYFEPADKPTFPGVVPGAPVYTTASQPFTDDRMSWQISGVAEDRTIGYGMLKACSKANVPVGAKVVAIVANWQRNTRGKVVPKALAAAGFREVMRTGNHNHPGTSTLYVYERVIQEGDYDEV